MTKAEALREAKAWLRNLSRQEAIAVGNRVGLSRGLSGEPVGSAGPLPERPFDDPHYWAAFILVGDSD